MTVSPLSFSERLWNVVSDPAAWIEGGLWGLIGTVTGIQLASKVQDRLVLCGETGHSEGLHKKVRQANKELFLTAVDTAGVGALALVSADRLKIISIASLIPYLTAIGSVATIIRSCHLALQSIKQWEEEATLAEYTQSSVVRQKAEARQNEALLGLIANVAMVAWAALGILALVVESVFIHLLMEALLFGGVAFWVAELLYGAVLNKRYASHPHPSVRTAVKV